LQYMNLLIPSLIMKIIEPLINWTHNYLVLVALVILITITLIRVSKWIINNYLNSTSDKSKIAPTRYHFLKNAISLLMWVISLAVIIYVVPFLRTYAITVIASAGVFLAILGLAAQQALSNIVSGVFIVIFKPFRVGDFITIADQYVGTVEDITLRHTVIVNFENRRIIIPNSIISSETVLNSSIKNEKTCESVEFQISYESDVKLAKSIMREEAEKHPFCIDNRSEKDKSQALEKVEVFLVGFGESAMNLKAKIWCENPYKAFYLHFDLNESIKERFDQEGIGIPYPHRIIMYKEDVQKKNGLQSDSIKPLSLYKTV
jgi:small conductance mechanosensitive channel